MYNNKFFKEKSTTILKNKKFYNGHYIIFSVFFSVVMFHEPQTWGLMAMENCKLHILYNINFIQFSSYNHWIKINFDPK